MLKKIKPRPNKPVPVAGPGPMTRDEREKQTCDPRSRVAELSAKDNEPIRVVDDDENMGGRRLFIYACNALYEQVPKLRQSQLQAANKKALHLSSTAKEWKRAARALEKLKKLTGHEQEEIERLGLDWMEAVTLTVYSATAAIETFVHETIYEHHKAEPRLVGRGSVIDMLKDVLPDLTKKSRPTQTQWWPDLQAIHRARNSLTHSGTVKPERGEEVAQAWNAMLKDGMNPPMVVRKAISHFLETEPWWIKETIEQAEGLSADEAQDG